MSDGKIKITTKNKLIETYVLKTRCESGLASVLFLEKHYGKHRNNLLGLQVGQQILENHLRRDQLVFHGVKLAGKEKKLT